jgi:hypothetical protein
MAPRGETIRVKGYREFLRAADRAGKESKSEVRSTFRKVGDVVKHEAARRFESIDARSAAGYRTRVRQRGVAVEQSLRRTTGKRPDFGSLQMRDALIPALEQKEHEVEREMEHAIDVVADHFERR